MYIRDGEGREEERESAVPSVPGSKWKSSPRAKPLPNEMVCMAQK